MQAGADPVITNPTEALDKLGELSRVSEQTNEALHNAQIDLDAKLAVANDADVRSAADQGLLDAASARVAEFAPAVNRIATANYQGARTNRLFALMVSDSPQQLLDQMSALDVIPTTRQYRSLSSTKPLPMRVPPRKHRSDRPKKREPPPIKPAHSVTICSASRVNCRRRSPT